VDLGGVPFAAAAEVVHERERLVEGRRAGWGDRGGRWGRGRRVGGHEVFCNAE
jgi:hypothetical protein